MKTKQNQTKVKTVSPVLLAGILSTIEGAEPIGLSTFTQVKVAATCPFHAVAKLSRMNAFTGANWEKTVNRQLAREGKEATFERSSRKWGQRIGAALVEHKGNYYLPTHIQHTNPPIYLVKTREQAPWIPVPKSLVAAYLPESKAANVGTEKELYYRDFSLGSITRLALNGTEYRVRVVEQKV